LKSGISFCILELDLVARLPVNDCAYLTELFYL